MSKGIFLFLYGLTIFAFVSQAQSSTKQALQNANYDALKVAIEHFDPNHEQGLTLYGDESQFMSLVLSQIEQKIPSLVAFKSLNIDKSWEYNYFQTLSREYYYENSNRPGSLLAKPIIEKMESLALELSDQCLNNTKSTVSSNHGQTVTWDITLKTCKNKLAQRLYKLGFDVVQIYKKDYVVQSYLYGFFIHYSGEPMDMQYWLNRLLDNPQTSIIGEVLSANYELLKPEFQGIDRTQERSQYYSYCVFTENPPFWAAQTQIKALNVVPSPNFSSPIALEYKEILGDVWAPTEHTWSIEAIPTWTNGVLEDVDIKYTDSGAGPVFDFSTLTCQ